MDGTGKPIGDAGFSVTFTTKVSGIQVLRVNNSTNPNVYPSSAPFVSFTQSANVVTINNITGLQTGYTWAIRLVAYGE